MRVFGVTVAALFCALAANAQEPIDLAAQMVRVEALMKAQGVDVPGYANTAPPALEMAPATHPYLQDNDGGYADGRIYISEARVEACTDLIVAHELVHDATVKHRLFAQVPINELKNAIEALADSVTEAAAEEPYRPGCLPRRRFAWNAPELAKLATRR